MPVIAAPVSGAERRAASEPLVSSRMLRPVGFHGPCVLLGRAHQDTCAAAARPRPAEPPDRARLIPGAVDAREPRANAPASPKRS